MQAFQQRVVDEKAELDGKIGELEALAFTTSATPYRDLPVEEQQRRNALGRNWSLAMRQLVVMREYSNILGERIANFS